MASVNPNIMAMIFGGASGQNTPGVTDEQRQRAGWGALGSLGASMLANSSGDIGTGQAVGRGFQVAQQGYQQNIQNAQRNAMYGMQIEQMQQKRQQEDERNARLRRMMGAAAPGEKQVGDLLGGTAPGQVNPAGVQGALQAAGAPTTTNTPAMGPLANLTPEQQTVLQMLGPTAEGAQYVAQNLRPQVKTLTGAEAQQLGLPEGSIVQQDPTTGKMQVLREGWDENAYRTKAGIDQAGAYSLANYKAQLSAATPDVRDKKARNLMEQGLGRNDAYNVVDGVTDMQINDKTGRVVLTNKATGEAREVPLSNPAPRAEYQGPTLWNLNEEDSITGPFNAAARAGNVIGGWMGQDWGANAAQAGQYAEAQTQNLVRALSNNPRYPVGEMERLRQEINLTPSVLDSESAYRNRLIAIDTALRQRLTNETRVANDPNQPANMREAASQAANDIQNFLENMGVPQNASPTPQQSGTVPGQQGSPRSVTPAGRPQSQGVLAPPGEGQGSVPTIQINSGQRAAPASSEGVPEGVDPEVWQYMTPEERALWLN